MVGHSPVKHPVLPPPSARAQKWAEKRRKRGPPRRRSDIPTMAAFFYLLAFMLFLGVYSSEPAPVGPGRWLRVGGGGISYFFALMSKPIAITFPVILLLWEILLGKDADGSDWKGWPPQRLWARARKHIPCAAAIGSVWPLFGVGAAVNGRFGSSGDWRGRDLGRLRWVQTRTPPLRRWQVRDHSCPLANMRACW